MGSLYWRQFMLSAGMVLLTMALLGVSFYALSYNYTVSEKRSEMRDRANLIAQLSVSYLLPSDEAAATQEDALRALAGVASRMTDVDFLICNRDGDVLLTSDAGLVGKSVRVPEEIVTRTFAEGDGYEGRSTVGVYEQKKFVVGVPMTGEDGAVMGLVLAVMDGTALMEMWRSFIGLFFMLSAIILLVAFVASSVTSMKQIKPITEMVQATRAYADGNFDVRMQETSSGGEIGELATAFNAMADSLQETERQRRDFIANVSHEIRTPLTVMNSYASALARGGLSEAEQREYAATIAAASESLSTMVSNILRLNKLENQEITPNAAPYDLTRQLCDCALTHEARWEAKNIDFDAQLEERVMVLADEAMMEIVFNNLISNAIKFTEAGGRILLRQVKDGDQVVVTVADTGCGMDEATLGRIFDKFYQGDTSHSKEGNGLGLALVRRVLEISGGSISVTSAPGEGSEFTVRLPRMPETA